MIIAIHLTLLPYLFIVLLLFENFRCHIHVGACFVGEVKSMFIGAHVEVGSARTFAGLHVTALLRRIQSSLLQGLVQMLRAPLLQTYLRLVTLCKCVSAWQIMVSARAGNSSLQSLEGSQAIIKQGAMLRLDSVFWDNDNRQKGKMQNSGASCTKDNA